MKNILFYNTKQKQPQKKTTNKNEQLSFFVVSFSIFL